MAGGADPSRRVGARSPVPPAGGLSWTGAQDEAHGAVEHGPFHDHIGTDVAQTACRLSCVYEKQHRFRTNDANIFQSSSEIIILDFYDDNTIRFYIYKIQLH